MIPWHPKYFFILGFLLVFTGFLLPLLMVLQILPSTFFLNFLSWITSVLGLFLGVIAVAYYYKNRKP